MTVRGSRDSEYEALLIYPPLHSLPSIDSNQGQFAMDGKLSRNEPRRRIETTRKRRRYCVFLLHIYMSVSYRCSGTRRANCFGAALFAYFFLLERKSESPREGEIMREDWMLIIKSQKLNPEIIKYIHVFNPSGHAKHVQLRSIRN